jgi:hypothetical protein
MKKPPEKRQARWGVFILKRKAERLSFTVTARDAEQPSNARSRNTTCPSANAPASACSGRPQGRRLPRSYLTPAKHPTEMVRLACTC